MKSRREPRIEGRATPDELEQALCAAWFTYGAKCMAARGKFTVALAGGETPRGLYRALAAATPVGGYSWDRVWLVFGDERAVGPDDPRSNHRMVRETLAEPVGLRPDQVVRLRGEEADLEAAARAYESALAEGVGTGKAGEVPRLDLVLLGMGEDGHTASLFPGADAVFERARWVVATRAPGGGPARLTMTLPVIEASRAVWFLVTGARKAAVVRAVHEAWARGGDAALPASLVRPRAGELVWWVDGAL